jgi:hypothetical protein
MKSKFYKIILIAILLSSCSRSSNKCNGDEECDVCTDCSRCEYCNDEEGSCGVCE